MKYTSGNFQGQKNINLFYQGYLPDAKPNAILLILHGLAEHSGRYMNVVNYFVPKGYAVYGFDQQGHGQSEGLRGYIEKYTIYISDCKTFFDILHEKHPDAEFFIIGHSVGATIATSFSISHQDEFRGLILSGVTITPGSSISPAKILMARLLSLAAPKMGIERIDASAISQDQTVVEAYINDPLVYHGKIRARLGTELLKAMQLLPGRIPEIYLPVLILSGTCDRLSNPESSRLIFERVSSADKTLKFYEGFYHEIFNEPGRNEVFSDLEKWLKAHL